MTDSEWKRKDMEIEYIIVGTHRIVMWLLITFGLIVITPVVMALFSDHMTKPILVGIGITGILYCVASCFVLAWTIERQVEKNLKERKE